jgi:uncharacterized protein YxjI
MSRYQMKQKWISWGDDYVVRDELGREVFLIDGKAWSLGSKLSFQNMDGLELAFISQKILSWGPTFEIYRNGALQAVVKKSLFTLLRAVFTIDVPGPNDLVAEGNFWDHEYTFKRAGQIVASVSKAYFSWTDSYGVEVLAGDDDVLVLAAAVIIDQCSHEKKK